MSTYELPREPGKQEYSNLGVALLGRLLARRAGMEYEPLLKQRILQPLGLNSTSITLAPDQERRLAPGHDRFLQPVETWGLRGDGVSTLFPSTEREFFAVTNDMRIIFESDARGVPVRLALHEGETVQHASRIADA